MNAVHDLLSAWRALGLEPGPSLSDRALREFERRFGLHLPREFGRYLVTKMRAEATPARLRAAMSPGRMVKTLRGLQGMTQGPLAEASGIDQSVISAMEHGRTAIGADRARKLGKALRVHPAVILFPDWSDEDDDDPSSASSASDDKSHEPLEEGRLAEPPLRSRLSIRACWA